METYLLWPFSDGDLLGVAVLPDGDLLGVVVL